MAASLHDPTLDADLSAIATYAWKTDAIVAPDNVEIQAFIVEAVERELQAKGLRPVEGTPDVWIVTYAGSGVGVGFSAPYLNGTWSVGVGDYKAQEVIEGMLVVSLVDPASDDMVWRGYATRTINPRDLRKLRGKIDKVTRTMFKRYPAR